MWFRRKPTTLGERGERAAAKALRRAGFKILARNARLGRYEIDLVAREGATTAFVEVKTRRTDDPVPPEDNVGPTKRRHIQTAARIYAQRENDPEMYYRFDVVSVVLPDRGKTQITILRDAFDAD